MLPKRTLMGPGPSDVSPEVLEAMSRPTIGHLDPAFVQFMDELNELLRRAFKTRNSITLPISAPGSAGMECCFVNLLEPGDKVVIAVNGVFGGRMVDVATRCHPSRLHSCTLKHQRVRAQMQKRSASSPGITTD